MKTPTLHIFNCDDVSEEEQIQLSLKFSEESVGADTEYFCQETICVSGDDQFEITSRYVPYNKSYSVSVISGDKHVFTTMGFKRSMGSADPCILYTTENGRHLQVSIETELESNE